MKDIELNNKSILNYLLSFVALLASANVLLLVLDTNFNASVMTGVQGLFNMNSEISIPTWYAQTILLAASILFLSNGFACRSTKKYWYGLAGIFLFLSIDEGASIHELLTIPVRQLLNISSGYLYYSWFIVYGTIFLILVILFLRFYMNLPRDIQKLMFMAAAIFITGSIGFEAVGASIAAATGETSVSYSLATVAEETFELLGVSILIYSLLVHLRSSNQTMKIKF